MKPSFSLFKKNLIPIAAIFFLMLFFAACKKKDSPGVQPPAAALMAVNLVPESTPVGVAIGGNTITHQPLFYNNYTGGYQSIFTGNRTLESFNYNTGNVLSKTTDMFKDSAYYTVFVMGTEGEISNVLAKDNFDDLTKESDMAYVRFVNAIPDSSTSTVNISDDKEGNVFNETSKYKSVSAFKTVTAGDVKVSIDNEDNINENRTITLEQGKVYTILISGLPNATDDDYAVSIKFIANGSL